jgi:hypothetical protein
MATTSIIADGTTELASAEFSLAAGETTTLSIRGALTTNQIVRIQFKASDSTFTDFGILESQNPVKVLSGIGTYRCVRRANTASFGVDRS